MLKEIKYSSVDYQIQKLQVQNLRINSIPQAKEALNCYGYSNIIKSYRDPYIVSSDHKIQYRDGVSFEQILSLYFLDKNLRNAVMASMLDLEEVIKAAAAEIIASSFGTDQDNYLQYKNYVNKKKKNSNFTLPKILDKLKNALKSDRDPIKYCLSHHGNVPPWILFKSIYFSTIVNFIDLFKKDEQFRIGLLLYDQKEINLPEEAIRKLLMDSLFIALDYRNLVAHGGRTYNYTSKSALRVNEIFPNNMIPKTRGFSELLFVLSLFRYKVPFNHLSSVLEHEVNRHCSTYPEDATYLGQILNINITRRDTVFISKQSNKYHCDPRCSGMRNAIQLDINQALESGYIPCKRCC